MLSKKAGGGWGRDGGRGEFKWVDGIRGGGGGGEGRATELLSRTLSFSAVVK